MEVKAYHLQTLALKHKDLCDRRRARNGHGTLDLGTNWARIPGVNLRLRQTTHLLQNGRFSAKRHGISARASAFCRPRRGIITGIVGAAGGFGGFLLPSVLGTIKDRSGTLALALACFQPWH